ncbi:MAG: polysaccharide biosynthesis/export family protein [Cycloclasticus sp.]|nr:polysaccharide biosynthesis/export family protein [Cycloclasticus sp.]
MACVARFFLILYLATAHVAYAESVEQYRLAPGDLIKIQVFGEPDLDLEIRLGSTGMINYPFLGKIMVSGLSLEGLEHKLVTGLKAGYLLDPQINTSIVEYRPSFSG